MSEITMSIPDETLMALKGDSDSLAAELLLSAAVKLYELGRLSSGTAATLAGIPRTMFLTKLADYAVSTFRLTNEELRRDFENA